MLNEIVDAVRPGGRVRRWLGQQTTLNGSVRAVARRLAIVVVAAATVAGALAAAAVPAVADTGRADAALSAGAHPACPDPGQAAREAAARFVDIAADHAHAADIGCLVYYRVTFGAGDGSGYDPAAAVTRQQMALFMTRAVKLADVDLPSGDQGFTDVGSSGAFAAGVNAAAALGIMDGTGATEFSPDEPVLRSDMALYLVRMLELLTDDGSPMNVEVDGATGVVTMTRRDGTEIVVDDAFDDVAGILPEAEAHAVGAIYELGVTSGTAPGVYDPDGRVTRAQMASFIMRALGHSSLRPRGSISLAPWTPPAPVPLPPDDAGVYKDDPLQLIAHASFERAYSLPGDGGDRLEVWLCNTPESGRRYSTHEDNRHNPANYAQKFAGQVVAWFEWLSGGLYVPEFSAGGVVEVGQSGDYYRACDEAVEAQDFSGKRIDGVVVVVGTAAADDGPVGWASCGFFSQRGFPDNSRSVLVNGDVFTDPALLAHELGHALCWPHSYSGETLDDDGEVWQYDNPMDIMGSPLGGSSDPVPTIGTLAINRYAAGWIPIEQVRIHRPGTTARYVLAPAGTDGVQLLVIPRGDGLPDDGGRVTYLALGARVPGSAGQWWADAGVPRSGVEIYDVDQSVYGCDLPDRGYCYGLARRTEPIWDRDDGYDPGEQAHVMDEIGRWWYWGEAGEPGSLMVELVAVDGHFYTVDVGPHVEAPEPEAVSDWEVGEGSRTRGDFVYAKTGVNIGSDSSPNWLNLFVRCTGRDELDIFVLTSESHFSGTPVLEYRFGGQTSPTSLTMSSSTDDEAGFVDDGDLAPFIRQLRADASGLLYLDLWDRPARGGSYDHQGDGVLGIAGVETDVEPVLGACGY